MWQAGEYCKGPGRGLKFKQAVGYLPVSREERSLVILIMWSSYQRLLSISLRLKHGTFLSSPSYNHNLTIGFSNSRLGRTIKLWKVVSPESNPGNSKSWLGNGFLPCGDFRVASVGLKERFPSVQDEQNHLSPGFSLWAFIWSETCRSKSKKGIITITEGNHMRVVIEFPWHYKLY